MKDNLLEVGLCKPKGALEKVTKLRIVGATVTGHVVQASKDKLPFKWNSYKVLGQLLHNNELIPLVRIVT